MIDHLIPERSAFCVHFGRTGAPRIRIQKALLGITITPTATGHRLTS